MVILIDMELDKKYFEKDKIIQLIVFKENLLGLTESGKVIVQEEYQEVNSREIIPTLDDKLKKRISKKVRWIEY